MLKQQWFYNSTIKNTVSVFGTLFNNINIVRHDGKGSGNPAKVPLAYGPKKKYLARIDQQARLDDQQIAIKLPRMSFEMTSIQYDPAHVISPYSNQYVGNGQYTNSPVPYIISMQLSIIADNQSDMLQIVEQILPTFAPTYTVSAYIYEGYDSSTDVPVTLQSVDLNNDYEGDFLTRQTLIYTLDFDLNINLYGGLFSGKTIKEVYVAFRDSDNGNFISGLSAEVDPNTAEENDPHTIVETIDFFDKKETITIEYSTPTGTFLANQDVLGTGSSTSGTISSIDDGLLEMTLVWIDGIFDEGELVTTPNGSFIIEVIKD